MNVMSLLLRLSGYVAMRSLRVGGRAQEPEAKALVSLLLPRVVFSAGGVHSDMWPMPEWRVKPPSSCPGVRGSLG